MSTVSEKKVIEVDGIGKTYGGRRGDEVVAAEDISFSVDDGEFFTIIGPSGCGKSTLLRILAELLPPSEGEFEIRTDEDGVPSNSMVFQENALFPWRTVQANVEFGLEMRGVGKRERGETARKYIEKVGLRGFEDSYPHQLSGGMRQRVNIARAFANDPRVLLMDEPLGALDAQTRAVLQEELLRIWEEEGKTIIYVTHSLEEAIFLSDRIALMSSRPGTIKRIHEVDIDRPRSTDIRNTDAFTEMYSTLWDMLEEEVEQSMAQQRGESE